MFDFEDGMPTFSRMFLTWLDIVVRFSRVLLPHGQNYVVTHVIPGIFIFAAKLVS